jgi:hypothetical protein
MTQDVEVVPGRNCHGCTLCCKMLRVEELNKPPLTWCALCDAKAGCKAYEERPSECRAFYCGYLLDSALDDRWKPANCKLIVTFEEHANEILIHVDPDRPDAWRKEPFYSQICRWALTAARTQGKVIVWQGDTKITISPKGQKDLHEAMAATGRPVRRGQRRPERDRAWIVPGSQPSDA